MNTHGKKKLRFRTGFVGFLFAVGLLVIGGRAIQLQVFRGPGLKTQAIDQYTSPVTVKGKRGTIFDANRSELAMEHHCQVDCRQSTGH
jgi:cell division protein FtsI/penicillin-binding protein 2